METGFKKDDLVWAKVGGYPWWPGFIKDIPRADEYEIAFFCDFSRSFLDGSKLKPFAGFREKLFKKNKSLLKAVECAIRIEKGETTIQQELELSETRRQPSLSRDRLKMGDETMRKAMSIQEQNSVEALDAANNSDLSELKIDRRFSENPRFSDRKRSAKDFDRSPGQFPKSSSETKQLRPTIPAAEGDKLVVLFEPIKQSVESIVPVEPGQPEKTLPFFSINPSEEELPKNDPHILNHEGAELAIEPQPPEPVCRSGVETIGLSGNTTSTFKRPIPQPSSQASPEELQLRVLELQLENIWLSVSDQHGRAQSQQIERLCEWGESYFLARPRLDKLWASRIGGTLTLLSRICAGRSRPTISQRELSKEASRLIDRIKKQIEESFFQLSEEHQKMVENIQKPSSPVELRNSRDAALPAEPSEREQSDEIEEEVISDNPLPIPNSEESMLPTADQGLVDSETIFRVRKKLALLIYSKARLHGLNRRGAEKLASVLEQEVQQSSSSPKLYKKRVVQLIKRLTRASLHSLRLLLERPREVQSESVGQELYQALLTSLN